MVKVDILKRYIRNRKDILTIDINKLREFLEDNGPIQTEEEYEELKRLVSNCANTNNDNIDLRSVCEKYTENNTGYKLEDIDGSKDDVEYEKLKTEILQCSQGYSKNQYDELKRIKKEHQKIIRDMSPDAIVCKEFWDDEGLAPYEFEMLPVYSKELVIAYETSYDSETGKDEKYPVLKRKKNRNRFVDFGKGANKKVKIKTKRWFKILFKNMWTRIKFRWIKWFGK